MSWAIKTWQGVSRPSQPVVARWKAEIFRQPMVPVIVFSTRLGNSILGEKKVRWMNTKEFMLGFGRPFGKEWEMNLIVAYETAALRWLNTRKVRFAHVPDIRTMEECYIVEAVCSRETEDDTTLRFEYTMPQEIVQTLQEQTIDRTLFQAWEEFARATHYLWKFETDMVQDLKDTVVRELLSLAGDIEKVRHNPDHVRTGITAIADLLLEGKLHEWAHRNRQEGKQKVSELPPKGEYRSNVIPFP